MLFDKFTTLNVNVSPNIIEDADLLGRNFLLFIGFKIIRQAYINLDYFKHNHIKKVSWISAKN